MTNWKQIHKDFAKKIAWSDEIYQQLWEKWGLTAKDAQEWTQTEFKPNELFTIIKWKNLNFTFPQVEVWITIGLSKYDCEFAAYLRTKGFSPSSNLNLPQLKEEFDIYWNRTLTPGYLDNFVLEKRRKVIKKLSEDLSQLNLSKSQSTEQSQEFQVQIEIAPK